ncbi:hypothetical protein [Pedobacter sp. MW01-1-1]|uniref:hypothetical protein n=1 Tax=Pedobacter sp. MW01-1-1 TaxID=3383027 RepID=UPI003FEFFCDE
MIGFVLTVPFNFFEYNKRSEEFQQRVNRNEKLSIKEKCGIYGNLLVLSILNYSPYNQLSSQNFYLLFPKKNKSEIFTSPDFLNKQTVHSLLKSKVHNKVACEEIKNNYAGNISLTTFPDSCILKIREDGESKKAILLTECQYRQNHTIKKATDILRGYFEFHINEGLFWYLQKEGWLFPYQSIWVADINR